MRKIGLNVGSGQRPFKSTDEIEWVNVDKVVRPDMPKPDWIEDGAHLPCADNSVDYFVLHHVLEHFGCGEAADLIKEAYRVLKPGGMLQVFVPNMRALAKRWLDGGISTQIYMTNVYGAYMGSSADRHHWGFDELSLADFLKDWQWQAANFKCSTLSGSNCAHDFWILEVECVK